MPEQFNLKECADCRWFQPINASHLCEQGTCYKNKDAPRMTDRYNYCSNFLPIEGEFDDQT